MASRILYITLILICFGSQSAMAGKSVCDILLVQRVIRWFKAELGSKREAGVITFSEVAKSGGKVKFKDLKAARYAGLIEKQAEKNIGEDAVSITRVGPRLILVSIDGMDGHGGGDVASESIADTVQREALKGSSLVKALEACPAEIAKEYGNGRGTSTMGAVFAAVEINGDDVLSAHVGDSKAIQIRGSKIVYETHDHSQVQSLIDAGLLNPIEAMSYPRRNVVTRSIQANGIKGKGGDGVEIGRSRLEHGDWLFLASDWVWDNLTPQEVSRIVSASKTPEQAVDNVYEAIHNIRGTGIYEGRNQLFKPDDANIIIYRHP